ncbi:MAG: hypothetical protein MN733_16345 [Nitrososphaera sp.]|nr:hypothetical protein [Nitrososphaera sp.]
MMPYKDSAVHRERASSYYYAHKEECSARMKRWYQQNKAKHNACSKNYYLANKDKMNAQGRIYNRLVGESYKIAAINMYSNGDACCAWCKQADIDVLCLDHINNNRAERRKQLGRELSGGNLYRLLCKQDYPIGFQVLCSNCNLKKEIEFRRAGGRNRC